jgi:hypothetical protein
MSTLEERDGARNPRDKRRFAHWNKNFLNVPMARDIRQRCEVKHFRNSERLYVDLPSGKTRFVFASDSDETLRRYPTGGEVDLLAQVMARAKYSKSGVLEFPSKQALLAYLGWTQDTRNRQRLIAGLNYWAGVHIFHRHWYEAGPSKDYRGGKKYQGPRNPHVEKRIKPPLRWRTIGKGVRIDLSKEWMALNKIYFVDLHLPLPHHAATQNLLLMRKAFDRNWGENDPYYVERDASSIAKAIGINPRHHRDKQLEVAAKKACSWYLRNKGSMRIWIEGDKVVFGVLDPKREPRPRVRRPKGNILTARGKELLALVNEDISDDEY